MLIRPPKFDAKKKYPMLVLLHGGPQTMWSAIRGAIAGTRKFFPAAGYVTLMINRRGSTGYGQKFTDEITNDWGGKAYVDVMKGVDCDAGEISVHGWDKDGGGWRFLWRLHGGLDRDAHGPVQGDRQSRRSVRQGVDVGDGGAVV